MIIKKHFKTLEKGKMIKRFNFIANLYLKHTVSIKLFLTAFGVYLQTLALP